MTARRRRLSGLPVERDEGRCEVTMKLEQSMNAMEQRELEDRVRKLKREKAELEGQVIRLKREVEQARREADEAERKLRAAKRGF